MDIQVGDRVTYQNGKSEFILNSSDAYNATHCATIVKIERPKYREIEVKKELLTEEEREFLRQILKFGNYGSNTENGIIKYIIKDGYYIELHYEDWACNTIYIDKNLYFRNLERNKTYTLKELGLEEN